MYISKDFIKRLIVVAIGISVYFALVATLAKAEITGAVGCNAGELAIINSDREAVWSVYPAEYSTSYAVSNDGKTIYFASPKHGKVTFFAASVVDGLPYLENHSLYNGLEIPEPTPTPTPTPEPVPVTLEDIVRAEATGKDAGELTALAESFEFIVDGIDRGTIKTPVAARETFRSIWLEKGTKVKETAIDDLSELIDVISKNVNNTTVQSIKEDYSKVAKAIRSAMPSKTSDVVEVKAVENAEQKNECPDGKCPTGDCPNGNCPNQSGQRFYYWRR